MKITFLGTGTSQGVPVIGCTCKVCRSINPKDKRLRTAVLIEVDDKVFVVDTGPDFRQQMLRAKVNRLDAVLYTHSHKDHTAGMDDVRAFNFLNKKPVNLYAEEMVQDALRQEYHYAFSHSKYPGIPKIKLHTIANKPFSIGQTKITPIRVHHHKLPVLGFRIKDFTYITDANFIPPEEQEKIKGSKVLVLNALRRSDHVSHFTLKEAVDLFKKIRPKRGFITHISHQMGLHNEVMRELPDFIELASDGLKVEI